MNELQRFKKLLEFFVSYLEYCQHNPKDDPTKKTDTKGFAEYILPLLPNGVFRSGQGRNGHHIQQHIKQWEEFPLGHICINVQGHYGPNYMTSKCYLNWYAKQSNESTNYNILAKWQSNRIVALKLSNYKYWFNPPIWEDSTEMTVSDLGLYDKNEPNEKLKQFFAEFTSYIQNFTQFRAMEPILQLIESNHNIILHGAPGTGKTFKAKQIAKQLNAETKFVQFHPSYDYTDFVEGLRPIKDGNNVGFDHKDGVFKAFCKKAIKAYNETADKTNVPKYVFIIDEINRGNMSKIFGELFFSIDPGYRGTDGKVDTQYQNLIDIEKDEFKDGFYIPENVYIIGTMNDIDRSVESMDFAMRRRFSFIEITAEESQSMLTKEAFKEVNTKNGDKDFDAIIKELKTRMNALNAQIVSSEIGLSHDYQIGAAYFLKFALYADQDKNQAYSSLWNNHLKSIITEYIRGTGDESVKLEKLKAAYDNGKTQNN
jgi:GTPase subunit of restriction endonuclease